MITLYGNNCTSCRYIIKMLDANDVKYIYHNVKGKTLDEIKIILGDDYETGLRFPVIYENDKFVTNIRAFIRRHDKKCILT